MVQKVKVELVCDACGDEEPAIRTIGFGFDDDNGRRREYKVELCERHLKEFGNDLARWMTVGRLEPAGSTATQRPRSPAQRTDGRTAARRDPEQLAGIRAWARSHGFEVSDRGKIPAAVEEAYNRRSVAD